MLCRTCGNPVKLRGERWECPYCCDCGRISLPEIHITVNIESRACPAPASNRTKAPAASVPDDGAVFHYCAVQIPGIPRSYAYLTGGLPLKAGSWVEVPFGRNDIPRRGQVVSLTNCTRATAPWPPEQTKTVLCSAPAPEPVPPEPAPPLEPEPAPESEPVPEPEPAPEPPSAPRRRRLNMRVCAVFAVILCIAGIAALIFHCWAHIDRQYALAVSLAESGSYVQAKIKFDALGCYHDAEGLAVYCEYADKYAQSTVYAGGADELSRITLRHSPELQPALDDLLARVTALEEQKRLEEKRAAAEKERAEAARKQAEEYEAYAGKLPVKGMPMRCLSLTSLGKPDKMEKCQFFDDLVEDRRSYTVYWYDSEGRVQAAGYCFKGKGEEYTLISFTYYDYSLSDNSEHREHDTSDPYDVEDYYTAEDFFWGNRAYFDSLDDAEAYFDNHKD